MEKTFLTVALAWVLPGLGHIYLSHWRRGLLLMGSIFLLTIVGVLLGGLYYPGSPSEFGMMYWLHQLAAAGDAVALMLNFTLTSGAHSAAAGEAFRSAYFEYGGRLLALAGLLNYLALIDVLDLSLKRKS